VRARPGGRVAVELDGVPWRTLPAEPVLRAGVGVGRELDRATARTLRRELRRAEALAVAGRSLRAHDVSARGLAAQLERAAVAPAARAEALAALTSAGLLDDDRFVRRRAAVLAERGYGNAAIAADLERQGVSAELVGQAIGELEPEAGRARAIVRHRGSGPRTARFLTGKGFEDDAVEAALRPGEGDTASYES